MSFNLETAAPEILSSIKEAKNILLHLHVKPDPDSIGSALAMYWVLKNMGKDVTVIKGDSDLPESLCFLPGADKIVHKNFFQIDLTEFDLFIALDSASLDRISVQQKFVFPEHLKVINIDHHVTNPNYGNINLVPIDASSTSEVLFYLFKEMGIETTPEVAACLYLGIYGDTGGFSHSNTTVYTMKAAASLIEIYPDFTNLIRLLNHNHPKGKIYFDGLALSSIETFFNDTVAISAVSYQSLQEKNITENDMAPNVISNILISVKDWNIGVLLTEREPNSISLSFRCKGDFNVAQIAETLGGGGHTKAAGAHLVMPFDEAKKKVVEAIGKFYGNK